jgi:hypothetical protein
MIEAAVPGSYSVAVDYPAVIITLEADDNYFTSVNEGIEDMKSKIEAYVAACGSGSRIALLGYSQGGEVVTDTLAGGTGKPEPIAETYRSNSRSMRWLTALRSLANSCLSSHWSGRLWRPEI